jgi:protein disulfide-isomerase
MRNKFIFVICCCAALWMQACYIFSESPRSATGLRWFTNYEEAVGQARATSKPLVLLFTGTDWCTWCKKLEQEALDTPEFAEAAGNRFLFVKLDFPLYSPQDPQLKAQNKQLQQKFDVRSFPTIILFDAQQNQQIGTTGYRPGGGRQYADHLLKMLNDYGSYKQKMGALEKSPFSGQDLKNLYEKAKELHLAGDVSKILKIGMESDASLFFLAERYRFLASEGQIHSKEASALRQQLIQADPDNHMQIPYQVAVIDFETYCEEMERESYAPEQAIAPLMSYMEKFGEQDKENLWRLQMIISQVYLDNNKMTDALKYAQASFESAPASAQAEIARAIQNIRSQIHSTLITSLPDN